MIGKHGRWALCNSQTAQIAVSICNSLHKRAFSRTALEKTALDYKILLKIAKIADKTGVSRGVFTLRLFYYRLELIAKLNCLKTL